MEATKTKYLVTIMGTIMGVLLIISAGAAKVLYNSNQTLKETKTKLEGEVTGLKADIRVLQASESAVILGQMLAAGDKEAFEKLVTDARRGLKKEEARIKAEINDPLEQAQALSAVRMAAVWEGYCGINPNHPKCVKAAPGASNAAVDGVTK